MDGYPNAVRMVLLANQNAGIVQVVSRPFGAYVIELTIRADNVAGAGLFVQPLNADYSQFGDGSANLFLSLLNKKDTSGWPGGSAGASDNYLRTFSWYFATPIDGNIAHINFYAMGNWENLSGPRNAKTLDVHAFRVRAAYEAEIAQKDPITGLDSKASHDEVVMVAVDKAGTALATARSEYEAGFAAVDGQISDAITLAAGPAGVVGEKISAVEVRAGGRQNLVANGSAEQGMTGIGGQTSGWTTRPANNLWGSSFVCSATPDATNAIQWPPFGVQVGETYTISADSLLFATAGQVYVDMLFLDAGNNIVPGGDSTERPRNASHDFSAGPAGKDALWISAVCPAGATQAVARFVWSGISGLSIMGVRQMQVERGAGPWTAYNQSLQPLAASVSVAQGAIATLDGRTAGAYFRVAVASPGGESLLDLASDSIGGTVFRVRAGTIVLEGNVLVSNSVGTSALADFSVNNIVASAGPFTELTTGNTTLFQLTITTTGKPVLIQVGGQVAGSEEIYGTLVLERIGYGQIGGALGFVNQSVAQIFKEDLAAGTYTYRLSGTVSANDGSGIVYPALILQEVKK
ncbi:MAG: hypothetical protein DI605_04700 [Sphingomonas sp.]|nr:MAG: hypothetical protein DI605_04700 [Sphingomonas sp.]